MCIVLNMLQGDSSCLLQVKVGGLLVNGEVPFEPPLSDLDYTSNRPEFQQTIVNLRSRAQSLSPRPRPLRAHCLADSGISRHV